MTLLPTILVALTALLVFVAGWRMCAPQTAVAGGTGSLLLFVLHPSVLSGMPTSSPWDAFFVMLFLCAWLGMENWSLFMRSWVLAGVYAFGLWVGSPFVLWAMVAMVPWVIFNRRPLAAVGSLLNIFLGGFFLFAVSWGIAWLVVPNLGRPLFTQWIRWGTLKMPPSMSLPWCLLTLAAVIERFQDMMQNRRADVSIFAAMLLVVTALFGSSFLGLSIIALSAPLIMRLLAKREFLFHRGVRWVAGITLGLSLVLIFVFPQDLWLATGLSIFVIAIGARKFYKGTSFPWKLSAQAACLGAYVAESLGTLIGHR